MPCWIDGCLQAPKSETVAVERHVIRDAIQIRPRFDPIGEIVRGVLSPWLPDLRVA